MFGVSGVSQRRRQRSRWVSAVGVHGDFVQLAIKATLIATNAAVFACCAFVRVDCKQRCPFIFSILGCFRLFLV